MEHCPFQKAGSFNEARDICISVLKIAFLRNNVCADMPLPARPQSEKRGRLSYTVTSPTTGCKVEVLLKGRAFRIKEVGKDAGGALAALVYIAR